MAAVHPNGYDGASGAHFGGASSSSGNAALASAPSPGISLPVTEWEETQVSSWLSSINLSVLAPAFREQGITGDVLVQLDNDALKDLGVESVGHRLALLGGIYKLKEIWGLDIEAGDYRPQSEEVQAAVEPPVTIPQLIACLRQRDERIIRLEQELRRTTVFLAKFQYDFTGICRYQGLRAPTTDYAFQPFVPASSSGLGHLSRKTSVLGSSRSGLNSPSTHAHPSTSSYAGLTHQQGQTQSSSSSSHPHDRSHHHNHHHNQHPPHHLASSHPSQHQPLSHSQTQTSQSHSHQLHSPAASSTKSSTAATASTHPNDSAFSGPHSAWSHTSSSHSGKPAAAAAATNDSHQQHQYHHDPQAGSGEVEERIRTPTSANPMEPPSPSFLSTIGGPTSMRARGMADDAASADGHTDAGTLSPAGLSSGSASTPTSATYPPWMRSERPGGAQAVNSSSRAPSASRMNAQPPPTSPPSGSQTSHSAMAVEQSKAAQALASARGTGPSASASHPYPAQTKDKDGGAGSGSTATSTGNASSSSAAAAGASSSSSSSGGRDFVGTATTLGTGDNPYKSFRVTLEDPCYKVLPAALKKYKINDDWRLYALFICYGTTERCLSYDEKPLLLFQKLKEARQNPVFMLRHIRDVKSPISIANAKAALRRGSAVSSSSKKDGSSSAASGGGSGSGSSAGKRRLAEASADSSGDSALTLRGRANGEAIFTGPAAQLPNLDGPRTFAIAIYPYTCERDDEFDVTVGDTFVVLSKAKGWWVVQRDSGATGLGDIVPYSAPSASAGEGAGSQPDESQSSNINAEIRSGWVPAGCLIETSRPLASVLTPSSAEDGSSSGKLGTMPAYNVDGGESSTPTPASVAAGSGAISGEGSSGDGMAKRQGLGQGAEAGGNSLLAVDKTTAPIPPSIITSTSTPGIMLMDYTSAPPAQEEAGSRGTSDSGNAEANGGRARLELKKDDRLRVFKRYNHWSYCVQESGSYARGWVPSWYIGKISSRSGTSSSSAAAGGSSSRSGGGSGAAASNGAAPPLKASAASSISAMPKSSDSAPAAALAGNAAPYASSANGSGPLLDPSSLPAGGSSASPMTSVAGGKAGAVVKRGEGASASQEQERDAVEHSTTSPPKDREDKVDGDGARGTAGEADATKNMNGAVDRPSSDSTDAPAAQSPARAKATHDEAGEEGASGQSNAEEDTSATGRPSASVDDDAFDAAKAEAGGEDGAGEGEAEEAQDRTGED